jgi:hypothetical protein
MVISDTTTRTGIVQLLEDLTGTQNVSSYSTAVKIRDINLAFDDYQNMVKKVAGTWQADDSNHTKYPNMKFDLTSGQQDYTFEVDEQGNQVQDIYRVECKDANGRWYLLNPVDEMDFTEAISQIDTESGTPTEYWKTANGIFLKVKPDYTQADGIRMFFTRSPNYFTTSDTTKEPGITNGHHRYLALKPAFWYWLPKETSRANIFFAEIQKIENEIKRDISNRARDEQQIITSEGVNPF